MAGRTRRTADKAAGAALNKAVAATTTPVVAAAARPVTRRAGRIIVGLVLFVVAAFTVLGGGTAATVISVPLLAATLLDTSSELDGFGPCIPSTVTGADGTAIPGLSTNPADRAKQLENAATIISVGVDLGVPARGWVVALATAMQESTLLNLDYGDRDSQGLFQQRPVSGWGTVEQITNPVLASKAFYGRADHTNNPGLLDITGWEDMPVTVAAQAVQRSAFPLAYAQHEDTATALVNNIEGIDPGTCDPNAAAGGEWVWPLNPLPAVSSPFGRRLHPVLGYWKLHDGTDYSASCGTPLYAAGSGTVRVEHPAWSGNLVAIDHGDGIETWYGHMQSVSVTTGQKVKAGQNIGEVGTLGYSTGCHLHFTVRVDGQPVDPVPWLTKQIENSRKEPAGQPPATDAPSGQPVGGLTVLTYNVHYGRASAATREVAALAARHTPDVICLQEAAGVKRAPNGYRIWRPTIAGTRTATPLIIRDGIPVTNRGGISLTGRVFVGEAGAGPARATPRHIVWATLDAQVTVGCTHFTASKDASRARADLWRTQASKSVTFLSGGGRRLLAGDFNATPDSSWMSGFRRVATPDANRAPTLGARIDMVWGAGGLVPDGARVLPKEGSDHRPLITGWTIR